MTLDHVLVTGGTGCIGSVTVRDLLALGARRITIATSSGGRGSLDLWIDDLDDPRLSFVKLDVSDRDAVFAAVSEARPTQVIHLGALQSPDCQQNPTWGMQVNVGGTLHLLQAAEQVGTVSRFVFASSAAVYGLRSRYPGDLVSETDELAPPNLYGVWKTAGEHLCKQFAERNGIATVCLRLNTTYGPGRDKGLTSAGTSALKAVAASIVSGTPQPYRMPYGGRENYHYVEDVGAHFAQVAAQPFEGYGAFNIRGRTFEVTSFLDTIREVATSMGHADKVDLGLADDAAPSPFVCDLDESAVQRAFEGMPSTELADGVRRSLEAFTRG